MAGKQVLSLAAENDTAPAKPTKSGLIASEMARAAELEAKHHDRAVELAAEIAALEPNIGKLTFDAQMAGDDSPAALLVEQLAHMRTDREVAEQAAAAAFDHLCDLQCEMWKVEAAELRRQARAKRAAAKKHDEATSELLGALLEHDGVEYIARGYCGHSRGLVVGDPEVRGVPRGVLLHEEADALDRQAETIEARSVPASGAVIGDSVESLLGQVQELGLVRAPTHSEITAWVEEAARAHPARASRRDGAHARFHLSWRDGRIDEHAHVESVSVDRLVEEEMQRRQTDERLEERRRRIAERAVEIQRMHPVHFTESDAKLEARNELRHEFGRQDREERDQIRASL